MKEKTTIIVKGEQSQKIVFLLRIIPLLNDSLNAQIQGVYTQQQLWYGITAPLWIIFSLYDMNILLLFLVFALVFYYDYSLYPNVTTVIDSTSLFLLVPFLIRSVYPPKRINYWKANQYAYASFHGSLPDDEITQCNDICGSVIPFPVYLIPSAQGAWSVVMESTIRFSPSDSL